MASTNTTTNHRGRGRPRTVVPGKRRSRRPTKQETLQALAEREVREAVEELDAWSVMDPASDRAAAVRTSRDKAQDGHSVKRDTRDLLRRELDQGTKLRPDPETGLPVFLDNNASASAIAKTKNGGEDPRKSYARLLRLMRDGEVRTMVFTKLDRICRDLMDINELCTLANDAALHGHTLTFEPLTAHPVDLNSAPMRGMACVLATFGQMETEMTRERSMNENRDRRDRGWFVGGHAPMGMVKDRTAPGGIRPDESLRALMTDALEDACAGTSFEALAERWEAAGVDRPRAEEPWTGQQVKQRLNRPTLAGIMTYQPPADSQGKREPRREVGRGAWEPLFNQAQWSTLQGLLAINRQGRHDPVRDRFTGIFRCPCGGQLYRHKQTRSGSHNWSCMKAKGGCGHNAINGPGLEAWTDAQTPARLATRGIGDIKPTADMERLRSEIRGYDGRLAIMEGWWTEGRYDDDPNRYDRERRDIGRKRDKATLALTTAEAELLGAKLSGDALLSVDYGEAPEDVKRRMIVSAFPHGILAAKGREPVARGEDGEPEAAAA